MGQAGCGPLRKEISGAGDRGRDAIGWRGREGKGDETRFMCGLDLTGQINKNIMSNKWALGRLCNDKTARTQLDDLIPSTYRRRSVPCLLCNLRSCLPKEQVPPGRTGLSLRRAVSKQ